MTEIGSIEKNGSASRARTCDPLINSQLLYQLSYRGMPKRAYDETIGLCQTPLRGLFHRISDKKRAGAKTPAEALGDGGCLQKKTGSNSTRMVNASLMSVKKLPTPCSRLLCQAVSVHANCQEKVWRPRPDSNRGTRICSPLRNHSATGPRSRLMVSPRRKHRRISALMQQGKIASLRRIAYSLASA